MNIGDVLGIGSFANQVADIVGINNWNIQEASYNGALFHWMAPASSGVDPLGAVVQYAQNNLSDNPQKPNYSTWSNLNNFQDTISRKLVVYAVPNYDGYYVEDYGSNGVLLEFVGLIFGTDYMDVLDKCVQAFSDSPNALGSNIGNLSGNNFRVLNHPLFGQVNGVYFKDFSVITASNRFQAASFKLTLIASDPSYLINANSATNTWQQQAQTYLNGAQDVLSGITQTFSLGQSLVNSVLPSPFVDSSTSSITLPVINGKGQYLVSIMNEIENKLITLSEMFTNCMAFLVQNDGGVVLNPFWQGITIDYSELPIFLAPNQAFSEADAQVIISFYNDAIDEFVAYTIKNGFNYNLQKNIIDLANSLTYMSSFAEVVLTQNNQSVNITTKENNDLYTLMFNNEVDFSKLSNINTVNSGEWYSCLVIPSGITVNMS